MTFGMIGTFVVFRRVVSVLVLTVDFVTVILVAVVSLCPALGTSALVFLVALR